MPPLPPPSSEQQQPPQQHQEERVIEENSRSAAGKELPPPAATTAIRSSDAGGRSAVTLSTAGTTAMAKTGTILLFYQYKEPEWTDAEHRRMLRRVIRLATEFGITGRGRIAPEGLNCTLSGTPDGVRQFCNGLRQLDPLFLETDFKLTDGIAPDKLFKSLSIRKTNELVAYGLAGSQKAPSIRKFGGRHLDAIEYHQAMSRPDTVIVDVRNGYESAIGNFQPPSEGAELIDPRMRNSIEFPRWLNDPSTKAKLHKKTVLMYCTGGIRCERATALLNQLSAVDPSVQPKGVYHLQGKLPIRPPCGDVPGLLRNLNPIFL